MPRTLMWSGRRRRSDYRAIVPTRCTTAWWSRTWPTARTTTIAGKPHGSSCSRNTRQTSTTDRYFLRCQNMPPRGYTLYRAFQSAWERLTTETNLTVLSTLLCEWLEHLKSPVIDKDNITYLVILCENLEKAFKRLPTGPAYLVEYLVRFVARIQPLPRHQVCSMSCLMSLSIC